MNAVDVVARPIARAARLPLLAPLAGRDFRLVWFGESVSLLGDQFNVIALSWLVLGMTGSGFALGAILIAAAIPRGLFMLVGGVLSDRISPRDLALASNVVRATLTTIVAALVLGAQVQLWQLALVGVVFGTVDAIFLPAINTLIPRLVPADRLAPANAVMQGTAQLVGTVGPGDRRLRGGAHRRRCRVRHRRPVLRRRRGRAVAGPLGRPTRSSGRSGRSPDRPAPRAPLRHPTTTLLVRRWPAPSSPVRARCSATRSCARSSIVSTATNLAFTGPTVVGLPWLVLVHFGSNAFALGLLFAAFGAGSLGGVLVAGSTPRPRRFGSIVLGLVLAMGLGLAAVGLAPSLPIVGVIALCVGAMNGYVGVVVIAWVQGRTDPAMLGRTMSFMMLGSVVAAPISLALAAIVVDTHAGPMFVAAGLLVVGAGIVAFASGLQRRMV